MNQLLEWLNFLSIIWGEDQLKEIAPLSYISESAWDRDREGERKYPDDSRNVVRYFNGDFLIIQKTSQYNHSGYTYDGKHNQMTTDEFRNYILRKVQFVQEILQNKQLVSLALEEGLAIDDMISRYLDDEFRKEYLLESSKKDF